MDDAVLGPRTRAAAAMLQTDERTRKMSTEMREPMEPGFLVKSGCYRAKEGEHVHRRTAGDASRRTWLCLLDSAHYILKWSDLLNPRAVTDAESLRKAEPDGSQEPVVRLTARCPNNDYMGYHCHGLILDPDDGDDYSAWPGGAWACPVGPPVPFESLIEPALLTTREAEALDLLMAQGKVMPLGSITVGSGKQVATLTPQPPDPDLERLETLREKIRGRTLRGTHSNSSVEVLDVRADLAALADAIDILIEREVRRG